MTLFITSGVTMADNFDIEEYLEEQVTKPVETAPEEDKKSRYLSSLISHILIYSGITCIFT